RILDERRHRPVAFAAADLVEEIADHVIAIHGVAHFGMELHRIELAIRMAHGGYRRTRRAGVDPEALRQLDDLVAVAHPDRLLPVELAEQAAALVELDLRLAVLALAGTFDLAGQLMRHHLHAVADPQNRN